MKSPTSSHHVPKSLAELSAELLEAKSATPEKTEPQQIQAQETEQQTIQPRFPTASENRAYRGWGINE